MRVAVAGKGGAGKTTTSATLARVMARRHGPVLCIDADANPNLAAALGLGDTVVPVLPTSIVSRRMDRDAALTIGVDELMDLHTVPGPDRTHVALMGMPRHAEEGCMCAAHGVVSAVLADAGTRLPTVVDLEASPEHFSRGTARHVDTLVFVVEPYFRSLETVRRMAALADELPIARTVVVGNKLRSPEDAAAVEAFCERHGLELAASLPWDDAALDADRDGLPLIDAAPESPLVTALSALVGRLTASA